MRTGCGMENPWIVKRSVVPENYNKIVCASCLRGQRSARHQNSAEHIIMLSLRFYLIVTNYCFVKQILVDMFQVLLPQNITEVKLNLIISLWIPFKWSDSSAVVNALSVFTGAKCTLQHRSMCWCSQLNPYQSISLLSFTLSPTVLCPGDRRLLRVVIRVADIMKVIVIRANVPRSQDTVALFASKARHSVPMGIGLIALSLLTWL